MMDSAMRTVQRYLFIGNDIPFFLHSPHTPLDVELGKKVLAPVVHSPHEACPNGTKTPPRTTQNKKQLKKAEAKAAPAAAKQAAEGAGKEVSRSSGEKTEQAKQVPPIPFVLGLIKTVITMKGKMLRRTNECLFAFAYCAREFPTDEQRQAVYDMLPDVLKSSRDFFQFLAYYMQLATQSGFGHGLRRAIRNWYDKHTALQLAEMLAKSSKCEGWTHRDVFAKVHLKLSCPEKQSLIDAAMKRTGQLNAGKPTDKKKGRKSKTNKAALTPMTGETTEALRRYHTMRQFRSAPNKAAVLEYINNHGMTLDMLPLHFRRCSKVWEALYPKITYRELLYAALPMQDFEILKTGGANGKAYAAALEKRFSALEEEQMHPIEVEQIKMMFEKGNRYHSEKEFYHQLHPPPIEPCDEVLQTLRRSVEHSFSHHPKTGVRYYIALDLRKPHEHKKVFRSDTVSCLHASVMLAFSIFKRERNVTVVAFTEEKGSLKPVQFTNDMEWHQALAHCQELLEPKTKVCLAAPIEQAEANKLKVNVFITITDSLIRVNPTGSPPYQALRDYRKKTKPNLSRYIAVSLSRHEPSFDFSGCPNTAGILEMVGYSATNAKIIDTFAKNLFI